jgi:hypothetical protein
MPETIEKALNMAIVSTNAEKEEKASAHEDWVTSVKVFTLGGSRGDTLERRYEKSRGKFQWSRGRGAWLQHRAAPTQYSTGVDGTYCHRTDSRVPMQSENQVRTIGRGRGFGAEE